MLLKNKKASVFIFILLLINISLIMSVVVYNNIFILNNNIDIWKNSQEVFSSIYNKWNIAIESVKKYNSNGEWFMDGISCPTNITMSGTTMSWTNISTNMVYDFWNIYCLWSYNWNNFRIYYDENFHDFKNAYYEWDVVDIIKPVTEYIDMTNNLATLATVTATPLNISKWISIASINDSYTGTVTDAEKHAYYSESVTGPFVSLELPSAYSVGLVRIYNSAYSSNERKKLNWAKIELYDSGYTLTDQTTIWNADYLVIDKDFNYSAAVTSPSKKVKLYRNWASKEITIREIEIYEWKTSTWSQWILTRNFNDSDNTFLTFDATWIGWFDDIDDNFNSDDYNVWSTISSTWNIIYYPNWYQDDDIIPRKTFFWNIVPWKEYENIFWNNYKTNDYIANNTNNNDILNVKIGDTTSAYLHLDLYNVSYNEIDLKILKFDRSSYQNSYTLLPLDVSNGVWITTTVWYIQNNTWVLSLSRIKTWNEYEFDFSNNDYAVFISNNSTGSLAYKLTSETVTWTGIYINPINDSGTWIINIMSNHMIIWLEKNFIWENFEVTGSK